MQRHSKEVHGMQDKAHKCTKCLKSFASSQQLAQHSLVHSNVRKYQCKYCEKAFKQLSHVQQHERMHTGERPYACTYQECTKAFAQLSNLQQHLKNHETRNADPERKPHPCKICDRRYITEASLNNHISKLHSNPTRVRDLKCQVCEKEFFTEEPFFRHIHSLHPDYWRVFSGGRPLADFVQPREVKHREKRFSCTVCHRCYSHETGLLKHMVTHPESDMNLRLKLLKCPVCDKVFTKESFLSRHMEMKLDEHHTKALKEINKEGNMLRSIGPPLSLPCESTSTLGAPPVSLFGEDQLPTRRHSSANEGMCTDQAITMAFPGSPNPGYKDTLRLSDPGYKDTLRLSDPGYKDTLRLSDPGYKDTLRLSDPVYKDTLRLSDPGYKDTLRLSDPGYKDTLRLSDPGYKDTLRLSEPGYKDTLRLSDHGYKDTLPLSDPGYKDTLPLSVGVSAGPVFPEPVASLCNSPATPGHTDMSDNSPNRGSPRGLAINHSPISSDNSSLEMAAMDASPSSTSFPSPGLQRSSSSGPASDSQRPHHRSYSDSLLGLAAERSAGDITHLQSNLSQSPLPTPTTFIRPFENFISCQAADLRSSSRSDSIYSSSSAGSTSHMPFSVAAAVASELRHLTGPLTGRQTAPLPNLHHTSEITRLTDGLPLPSLSTLHETARALRQSDESLLSPNHRSLNMQDSLGLPRPTHLPHGMFNNPPATRGSTIFDPYQFPEQM